MGVQPSVTSNSDGWVAVFSGEVEFCVFCFFAFPHLIFHVELQSVCLLEGFESGQGKSWDHLCSERFTSIAQLFGGNLEFHVGFLSGPLGS